MLIRPYVREDFPEVKALHQAQGLDYELPDLDAPSMLVRCVIEEKGRVTHAAFLRKTSEAYWIFDPRESKRERVGRMLALNNEMAAPADRAGIEDVHAFLPPAIVNQTLHKTLLRLGWVKPLWVCYSRKVNP
jgi:hypothetical protein